MLMSWIYLRWVVSKIRTVAALCVSGRSIYRHRPGVLAYGEREDARTFPGGIPVVAHPPCRTWSKYLRHQARPADLASEQELGVWCVNQVIRHGGCLEQPAGSLLWQRCGLPMPGDWLDPFLYTLVVEQNWWGFGTRKLTWVLVSGVPRHLVPSIPFRFDRARGSARAVNYKEGMSRTMAGFADWLLLVSRLTWHSLPVATWGLAHY